MNLSRNDSILLIVYINVILYATCFQLQKPLEPFLVDKLISQNKNQSPEQSSSSSSADEYARLQSFFSIVQTVGSLLTGYFLDKFSAKAGFLITFLASALSYYILSISTSIELLYISKIPTIFQSGFLCAQLSVSQLTADGANRVQALGRLTMCYTIGMVLGPAMGGWLGATGDYYFAAKLSAIGSLISVGLTLFMPGHLITSSHSSSAASLSSSSSSPSSLEKEKTSSWKDAITTLTKIISVVWLLLSTKILTGVANAMNGSALPLILKNIYHFKETDLGIYLSINSALNTLLSGFLLGPIIKILFQGNMLQAVTISLFAMTILSFSQAILTYPSINAMINNYLLPFGIFSSSITTSETVAANNIDSTPSSTSSSSSGLYSFIVTTYLLSIFQSVLATTLTGESTSRVGSKEQGSLLGLEHSLFAAARVVAPTAGVALLKYGGISLVATASAIVFGSVLTLWRFFLYTLRYDKKKKSNNTTYINSNNNINDNNENDVSIQMIERKSDGYFDQYY